MTLLKHTVYEEFGFTTDNYMRFLNSENGFQNCPYFPHQHSL